MQTRTKSALLLFAVLVLGVAIGILASGVLHNRRLDRIARLRTAPGIIRLVERAVEPESEEQRAAIREIMEGAAPRFAETFQRTQEEMRVLSDSVMSELEEVLTAAQLEDLREQMLMRRGRPPSDEWNGRERAGRRGPRDGGPPPDGRPPPPRDGAPPPEDPPPQ
ncbi:MAG: hypothetical protein KJO06_06275 [Gemmatimonadetes bacterium]|nr:hypothetical protein [Gemmatimonadota bacterium]